MKNVIYNAGGLSVLIYLLVTCNKKVCAFNDASYMIGTPTAGNQATATSSSVEPYQRIANARLEGLRYFGQGNAQRLLGIRLRCVGYVLRRVLLKRSRHFIWTLRSQDFKVDWDILRRSDTKFGCVF